MALIDELKEKREVWRLNVELHDQRALDEVGFALAAQAMVDDLDTAIAALEPAPAEPEAAPYSIDWGNEPAPAEQAPTSSPSTDEGRSVTPATEEESGDQIEDEPSEFISDLTGDPAISPESGLRGQPEPTELDAPVSIVDNPELQAAVARAEQALAIDAQTCEPIYPHPQPAYVGLQDPELDAEYEAMKEREHAERKKHFSIFGHRKLEEVS